MQCQPEEVLQSGVHRVLRRLMINERSAPAALVALGSKKARLAAPRKRRSAPRRPAESNPAGPPPKNRRIPRLSTRSALTDHPVARQTEAIPERAAPECPGMTEGDPLTIWRFEHQAPCKTKTAASEAGIGFPHLAGALGDQELPLYSLIAALVRLLPTGEIVGALDQFAMPAHVRSNNPGLRPEASPEAW